MQYKFFVDGEWRHDEHQAYVPGEYGMVNTAFLPTDSNYMPVLNPDAPGNSMDVDNEAFRRVVRVSHTLTFVFVFIDWTALCIVAMLYLEMEFQNTDQSILNSMN